MGRITETVTVLGKEVEFLIDTGADFVSVDRAIYPKVVKETMFSLPVQTAGGKIIKRVGLGELNIRGCKVKAFIAENFPDDHKNRLGNEILQDMNAEIDEKRDKLSFRYRPTGKTENQVIESFIRRISRL